MPALDLDQDQIVAVARQLIAAEGLDRFSMRKLAAALDVNPMTIYLRFENKNALLDAVVAASLAEFEAPIGGGEPWADQVLDLAVGLRTHLVADRETLRLLGDGDRLTAGLLGTMNRGLELMSQIRRGPEATVEAFRILFWHVVGSALVAGSFPTMPGSRGGLPDAFAARSLDHPHLGAHADHFGPVDADALFLTTTRLLVEALEACAVTPSQPQETRP